MNFTPTQQQNLLSKMGYDGPADSKMMEAFIASSPGAAAKMGKFSRAMQKRTGMATGGPVSSYQVGQGEAAQTVWTYNGKTFSSAAQANAAKAADAAATDASNPTTTTTPTTTTPADVAVTDPVVIPPELPDIGTTTPVTEVPEAPEKLNFEDIIKGKLDSSPESYYVNKVDYENNKKFAVDQSEELSTNETVMADPDNYEVVRKGNRYYIEYPDGTSINTGYNGLSNATARAKGLAEAIKARKEAQSQYDTQLGLYKDYEVGQLGQGKVVDLETAKGNFGTLTYKLSKAFEKSEADPDNEALKAILEDVQKEYREAETQLNIAMEQNRINLPTGGETVGKIFTDPNSMVQSATTKKIAATPEELISAGTGQLSRTERAKLRTAGRAATAAVPEKTDTSVYEATRVANAVRDQAESTTAVTGEVSQLISAQTLDPTKLSQLGLSAPQIEELRQVLDTGDLEITEGQLAEAATLANQGIPLPQAIAQVTGLPADVIAATFETPTPGAEAVVDYDVPPTKSAELQATQVEEAAKAGEIPTAEEKVSDFESTIEAVQGTVGAEELVEAKDIVKVAEAIEVTAATMDALNEASVAQAVSGTLSQAALATAEQGSVPASATVSGQIAKLMEQFNDGTPAWAAGAMRAANAAMGARGLGASSMAGAAIVQASMEAAMPIAQADAQMFMQMELTNLNNRQQVALANAAAQQNIELANLGNEQQVALQNSANSFALQSQNLSNTQAAVVASAQIKASLQGKVLDIYTQTSLANAARYAEVNNINLSNEQQTLLTRNAQNLQVNLANLDSTQQTALANLQVRASIRGQELTNEQQMAMLESTQSFQVAEFNASAKQQAFLQDAAATLAMQGKVLDNQQQTELFNISNIIQERNLELTGEQQTRIFNATNRTNVSLANLSSRQQTALANAQIEAALRGQELTNAQQVGIVNSARIAEVANINFTADQQRAIENAKIAQSIDLANLNSSSAKLLSDAAAMSQLDMTNLNNRQQAQVQNAQNLLQMDLTNLSNQQQTAIFTSQSIINSMLSDQAAENAAEQFNAASENQVNQFFADLEANISRFNADQANAMSQFNAGEANATERFNAQLEAARDQFNASNALIIAQSNAKWRQTVTMSNTEAQNEANRDAAAAANAMTAKALDDLWQRERDIMAFGFSASENQAERDLRILLADKDLEGINAQLDAREDAGKTQMYMWAADKIIGDWD